jgi:alkylation response protein AidB-like acyl-CoA dehydrogenase
MQRDNTPEDRAWRTEVRGFLQTALPPLLSEKVRAGEHVTRDELRGWQDTLRRRGWLVPHWTPEWGGCRWTPMQRHIFEDECASAYCPALHTFNLSMIGPILQRFGTPAQQQEHLPRILASERWWCQGYSEPSAGSDLAALATRAERDGEDYVINGSKIWTSLAHWATHMFCLVRTTRGGKPQEGISFLLVDMAAPGITVTPIISISGQHSFNQVFLDNVRVPATNLVGTENAGWTIAKALLEHERLYLSRVGENKKALARLKDAARRGEAPLIAEDWFRRRAVQLEVRLRALERTVLRFLAEAQAGRELGPGVSILKLRGSTLLQDMLQTTVEVYGHHGLVFEPAADRGTANGSLPDLGEIFAVSSARFQARGYTIAGGSSEVQRNIMARHVLRLAA